MTPAVAYLRSSSNKSESRLEGQRKAVQACAKKHGFTILHEYKDDGVSGATGSARPEFHCMIADAQDGAGFKAVLTYDVSRFGRMNDDETENFRYILQEAGVRIVFASENGE